MKSKSLALLVLPSLLLTSCTGIFGLFGVKSEEKEINVYDIDRLDNNNLSSGFQSTVKARFVKDKVLVPYLSLKQYASLYEKHFANDVESIVEKQTFSTSWTIKKGGEYCFVAEISNLTGEIIMAGSIEAAYSSNDDPRDMKALNYGLDIDTRNHALTEQTYATFSFSEYDFTTFTSNSERFYPLGLLDVTFSGASGIYFTYNYAHILSTRDIENYAKTNYVDNGNTYTFDSQMVESKPSGEMPKYLAEYNAKLYLYLMDNFYGLKEYKGVESTAKYLKDKNIYNNLFSVDPVTRTWAYCDALAMLDDNHTVLVSVNKAWGDPTYRATRRYGEGCRKRHQTGEALNELRSQYYSSLGKTAEKDIIYSEDGKTALFSFDSFAFGTTEQVFNEDESIKETAKDYDTFFKLIDAFKTIKAKGTVENVVFDIAVNGGGYVTTMAKLLALVSKDNSGHMAFFDDTIQVASAYSTKVDSNGDKKYDKEDCFGDDFNIYLLTSDYSFSCGNAFPAIAQKENSVKIIGQKSGGGECAVAIHYLPNSEYVYHSSNLHIGLFDEEKNTFTGFEGGATPDIEISDISNFYSVEYLNNAIRNAQ